LEPSENKNCLNKLTMLKKALSLIANVSASCLMAVVFLFPQVSHGAFGDLNYSFDLSSPSSLTTASASHPTLTYSCMIGQELETFQFYTRSSSGSRTLTLVVDGATTTAITNTTTPSWLSWTGLNIPCYDGTFDIRFVPSAVNFYIYYVQPATFQTFSLSGNITGGGDRLVLHKTSWTLPVTLATTSTSTSMATTTVISSNDATLNFLLLYLVFWLTVFGLVFIFRPLYVRK